MIRRVVGFHQDEASHWVADLDCGHGRHVRHNPPLESREWVLTEEGRRGFLGYQFDCKKCDAEATESPSRDVQQ